MNRLIAVPGYAAITGFLIGLRAAAIGVEVFRFGYYALYMRQGSE